MSKTRRPQKQKTRNVIAVAAHQRGGAGVHADQKRRNCPKALRRDKSYRSGW
jgi:hypothetical protein